MSKSERLQRCGSLKRTPSSPRSPTSPSQGIQFDKVTVIAPSGKVLARELTFQVNHFLLICPNSLLLLPHLSPSSPSAPSLSPLCCMQCMTLAVMLQIMFTEPMCELALTAPQLHGPVHQRRQPGPLWTVNSLLHRSMLTLCAGVARQQHSGDRPQWIW